MRIPGRAAVGLVVAASVLAPWGSWAGSPQHAVPGAAEHKATVAAYRAGCGWVAKTMPDPSWRPFLTPLNRACETVGAAGVLLRPERDAAAARAAARYVRTMARVTETLDAIYMAEWRERLATGTETADTVGLNDTGVFLAFQVAGTFRLANRVLDLHGGDSAQTAAAKAFQ
jgi:hypothetical protein